MKTFRLGEKEIQFCNSWEDFTINQWIEVNKLTEKNKEKINNESDSMNVDVNLEHEFYLLNILEILCSVEPGGLDALPINDYVELLKDLDFLLKQPQLKNEGLIEVDGVKYKAISDLNALSTGEYFTIKTLQDRYKDRLDGIPFILSVLIRPAIFDGSNWNIEEFNASSVGERAGIILEKFKAVDVIFYSNFFLNGK
jgi:hypothetical protein